MAKRVSVTTLNASTKDILNVIRKNASLEYQSLVPKVTKETDIPKVGEVLYGYPALANQFISALVNRIALVKVNSATFNNAYKNLKKGFLEFGETVEEVFVEIAKVRVFNPEKAEAYELKRTLPGVDTAFHAMNWMAQYPVTIQNNDLRLAFTTYNGVEDLIAKIVDSLYTASEYDEYLLFKYMLIKAISSGRVSTKKVTADMKENAAVFRGMSNAFTFMRKDFNEAQVLTTTPKDRQVIFMDAEYNAKYDVEVLASAFNMSKADFMGRLYLIDDWATFDNERFETIRAESDMLEEVTADELEIMKKVKAVLVDSDWFQVYDNLAQFSEKYVSSGLYWNYFYNTWKTFSCSPFSSIVAFVTETVDAPQTLTVEVTGKDISAEATVLTLSVENDSVKLDGGNGKFIQTETLTSNGIAVHPYGVYIIPADKSGESVKLTATYKGETYESTSNLNSLTEVGTTFTLNKLV